MRQVLPAAIDHFRNDFYGKLSVPVSERLIVVHYAVMAPQGGLGLANYCHSNPGSYRWHRSIGSDGSTYRCGKWDERGAHDKGLNHRAVGLETTARSGTEMRQYPKLMHALAREVCDCCRSWGKAPSRDFIIGHYEDAKFGGTSTHTDPMPGWDWGEFMDIVAEWWEGETDMTAEESKQLNRTYFLLHAFGTKCGLDMEVGSNWQIAGETLAARIAKAAEPINVPALAAAIAEALPPSNINLDVLVDLIIAKYVERISA